MRIPHLSFVLLALAVVLLAGSCAVIPICPGQRMPIVELQVNNTASTNDDYINTAGYVPVRARIVNIRNFNSQALIFAGGVEVEFRNPGTATDLVLSPTASGTGTAFFTTLPGDGSWLDFFVRGNTTSSTDKSAVIELATAGTTCNEVVVSRKALQVTTTGSPISSAGPQVSIQVGSVSHLDDYIGWGAVSGSLTWLNPGSTAATLPVTIRNLPGTNRLRFASTQPATGNTAVSSTVNLTLPGDGSSVTFYVAGNFGSPSLRDKDAVLEVVRQVTNDVISREGLMVRIRKNVVELQPAERERYLEALRKTHLTYDQYMTFVNSHSQTGAGFNTIAHRQAHNGSAFLPWHRAYVLHLERILQAADPSVSLPYWHFDQNSSAMFNANFLGSNPSAPQDRVTLNASNPISTWTIPGQTVGIRRRTPYGDTGTPGSVTNTTTPVITQTATLALGSTYGSFKSMEGNTHNGAHNNSGNTVSWVAGNPAFAPRDPMFFSLHCNIDRLWSRWQWLEDAFEPGQTATYDLQGSHASPPPGLDPNTTASRTLGQYLDDTMWPWDNVTGGSGTAERPTLSNLNPFPIVLGGILPLATPTVKSMLDYRPLRFDYSDTHPY